jgi:hypothetical protein
MASCTQCKSTILFGGVRDENGRFCDAGCQDRFQSKLARRVTDKLPQELIDRQVAAIHEGNCPLCGKTGPVDFRWSHRVWSAILTTSWSSRAQLSCVSCGRKAKLEDVFYCLTLGWWGFPWGFLATPIQISRNLLGLFGGRSAPPSPQLTEWVKRLIAEKYGETLQDIDAAKPAADGKP